MTRCVRARRTAKLRTAHGGPRCRYDPSARRLVLGAAEPATRSFQLLEQTALVEHDALPEAMLDLARFLTQGPAPSPRSASGRFLERARELRHDLEARAPVFDTSFEQVVTRLSTLQRPGAKAVPFFFVRVDQAGTITKRRSAAPLHFARFGGACPLWNVHAAFGTSGRFLHPLIETPDGAPHLCLARGVSKPRGRFHAPVRRAIGLGCEIARAGGLVHAGGPGLRDVASYQPIRGSCSICERREGRQRAVPPLERPLAVDAHERRVPLCVIG